MPAKAAIIGGPHAGTVVAQMIVNIGDEDREGHTSPQLLYVGLCVGAMDADRIHDLGVSVFCRFCRLNTEHSSRGEIHNPLAIATTIKPADQGHR